MKLKLIAILCFVAVSFVLTVSAEEKSVDETIKVKTSLVSVPVIVSDHDGRYIPNIKESEFKILQDGVSQKIEFFAAIEEPINVALLIDTSGSTRSVINDIKKSATSFVKLLQPADKAMVASFDADTKVLSGLTSDQQQLKDAIQMADIPERSMGTTLRDAVSQTVKKQLAGINGRKAIILMTDGKDRGSQISTDELIQSLEESDVIVYTIYFKTEDGGGQGRRGGYGGRGGGMGGGGMGRGGMGRGGGGGGWPQPQSQRPQNTQRRQRGEKENENAEEFLQKLSDTTAGRLIESKGSKFKDDFEQITDELRHQYRLGYYPPDETGNAAVHTVRVKVMRPDLVVRARSNYVNNTN